MLTALFNRISRRAKLEVDAKKLVYIDHAGSAYLESLQQQFERGGGSLKIISASSP
jgi:ABC-type transporter Mla MlaB component